MFFLLFSSFAFAQEEESFGTEAILQVIIYVLSFVAIVYAFNTIGIIGSVLVYIIFAIVFFSTIYILHLAINFFGIELGEFTLDVWAHLLFYSGMLLFAGASRKISKYNTDPMLSPRDITILGISAAWWVALIALIIPLNPFVNLYAGTLIDTSGAIHFIAFGIALYAAVQVNNMKKIVGKLISNSIIYFLISIVFLGLIHLWELLTESWKVISLPDTVIESTELVLFTIAMISFILAFRSIKKAYHNE
ncbi:MAG: hypothetical protein HYT70_02825 [Candidatus Aenigmarchaeota archaeon]|nr:hypothetical protein [Candidatus Aenigmarchaeota archaeon]